MPSVADPSKQDFDLTDADDDGKLEMSLHFNISSFIFSLKVSPFNFIDFSFFLIEPWFMCISLIVLMLIIVAACIKMIIDKKDAEIYLQTLGNEWIVLWTYKTAQEYRLMLIHLFFWTGPDGKPSPLDKVIKPRLIVIVCTVMIAIILLMNFIASCVRAFGDDDDEDDHED